MVIRAGTGFDRIAAERIATVPESQTKVRADLFSDEYFNNNTMIRSRPKNELESTNMVRLKRLTVLPIEYLSPADGHMISSVTAEKEIR